MSQRILTVVSATVDPDREADLVAGFHNLLAALVPDGLMRTELLRNPTGGWQIQTLWRDQEALDKMRTGSEPPAAPQLFRSVGADPSLQIFEVIVEHVSPPTSRLAASSPDVGQGDETS
jgi:hypothetical protein